MPRGTPDAYLSAPMSRARRAAASAIDAALMFGAAAVWFHWSEWARYTRTFGRQVPSIVAMPVMAVLPLALIWLEAITGRGAGKGLLGLQTAAVGGDGDGRPSGRSGAGPPVLASPWRRTVRALLKWSPVLVGPAVWIVDAFTGGTRADDFTNDHLLPAVIAAADAFRPARQLAWGAGVALRGLNWGTCALAVLAAGQAMTLLPSGRTLLDRVTGTRVTRAADPRAGEMNRPLV